MPFQSKPPFPPDDAQNAPLGDEETWEVEADSPAEESELYDQGAPIVSDEELAAAPTVVERLGQVPAQVRLLALVVVLALIVLLIVRACAARPAPAPAPTATPTIAAGEVRATFTPTPSSGGVLTDTAPLPATPLPTPIAPVPGAFSIGQRVEVFGTEGQGIRFRTGPGLNYITTTILQDGVVLTVVGGPEQADGFTWWRLQMDTGAVGWAAGNNLRPAP
ncbi:MAG: SH3 domain-containing protein [Caldilineales bacterium]|nr:SH3 domain-containing protein [Caldilineales bacterium]